MEILIDPAVEIATNYLVPEGLDGELWRSLGPEEKFYLKGIEVETQGELRAGLYQEFARGLGLREYRELLGAGRANEIRLKSAIKFKNRRRYDAGFGRSPLRNLLFAIHETHAQEDARRGRAWLKDELPDYWNQLNRLIVPTRYLARVARPLPPLDTRRGRRRVAGRGAGE